MSGAPRYLNREASWLKFNERVLSEAENSENPLLERIKFLAIFESNLDEFYMVRVSGFVEQLESGVEDLTPDGLSATAQLELVRRQVLPLRRKAARIWRRQLAPALRTLGVFVRPWRDIPARARAKLSERFEQELFPLCTPLLVGGGSRFPFISNRSLNLAVDLADGNQRRLARLKVPSVVPRLLPIQGRGNQFVLVEEVIAAHLERLFPGVEIVSSHPFRVIRDADIELRELESPDLISQVEQSLRLRRFGDAVLLETRRDMPMHIARTLMRGLDVGPDRVTSVEGPLGLQFMWELAAVDLPEHKFEPHRPHVAHRHVDPPSLFDRLRRGDLLLHHPYDSFQPVEAFVASAATDPNVIGIKQTLYRVGERSPIVESLVEAAEAGKQVAVMVELKARFDESNNLTWSRRLERAGAHVTYGFADKKTHCKLCLVVRREGPTIRQYAHVGTGNYNPSTARLYTDLGLMTTDPDICQDINELFNHLTGLAKEGSYRKLLVAPLNLREEIIRRIQRETDHAREGRRGYIAFKVNSLVDPEITDALYDASKAGVEIDLVVRGICCLRPGVPGLSERIRVLSLVGRFLEHSRVYYFANGGDPEAFVGSADIMRRNLDRRIEAVAPVREPAHLQYLLDAVIGTALKDNTNAWELDARGRYRRRSPGDEPAFSAQAALTKMPATEL